MALKGSVGDKKANGQQSENHSTDVITVRVLLNFHIVFNPLLKGLPMLPVTGNGDMTETIRAIRSFQLLVLNLNNIDGRVDKNGTTIKALMGKVSGMPEVHATDEELVNYKLRQARDSDEIEYMDIGGETSCLINLLLKSDSNDRYFNKSAVKEYIKNAPHDRPPKPPDEAAWHLKNYVKKYGVKKHTISDFIEFLRQDVRLEVVGGMGEFRMTDEWTRQAIDDSRTIGPGAAYRKLMVWFIEQKVDKNSVYACIGTDIDITQ